MFVYIKTYLVCRPALGLINNLEEAIANCRRGELLKLTGAHLQLNDDQSNKPTVIFAGSIFLDSTLKTSISF